MYMAHSLLYGHENVTDLPSKILCNADLFMSDISQIIKDIFIMEKSLVNFNYIHMFMTVIYYSFTDTDRHVNSK